MPVSGILRSENVVFYHPLDDYTEYTQPQDWTGDVEFEGGKLPQSAPLGLSAITSSSFDLGANSGLTTFIGNKEQPPVFARIDDSRAIVYYRNGLIDLAARVVSVSGVDVVLGPEESVGTSHYASPYSIAAMSGEKFVVTNRYINTGHSYSWVLSVSGDTVSAGSSVIHKTHIAGGGNFNGGSIAALDDTRAIVIWAYGDTDPKTLIQARVGTVNGDTITYGSEQTLDQTNYSIDNNSVVVAALSPSSVIVVYGRETAVGKETVLMTVSVNGDTVTSGEINVISPGEQVGVGVCAIDSERFAISYHTTSGVNLVIGQISGTTVTYGSEIEFNPGPGTVIAYPNVYKLDTDKLITCGRVETFQDIVIEIFAASGITLTSEGITSFDDENGDGFIPRVAATALNGSRIVLGSFDGTTEQYVVAGELGYLADLTAISGSVYPSASGATRVVSAFWGFNPSRNDTVFGVDRGYEIDITSGTISLGSGAAVWDIDLGINDDSEHLLVCDFEHSGGTTWYLNTSVDGSGFVYRGIQTSGTQSVITLDTAPSLTIDNGFAGTQWIDELVLWVGDKTEFDRFTNTELSQLHDLAQTYDLTMPFYYSTFLSSESIDLYVLSVGDAASSGNLFIKGVSIDSESIDLYLLSTGSATHSGDLFIKGRSALSGIYWTDYSTGQLNTIDPNLDIVSVVASGMSLPKRFYANSTDGKFYIVANNRVYRCDYDGANLETIIVNTDLPPPNSSLSLQGIVVDESGAKLYFNDSYYGRVYRANLDGSSLETIYDASADAAYGGLLEMVIDPVNEYVYWTTSRPAGHPGVVARNIERIDYDGSNFTIIASRNSIEFPFTGLALDVSGQIMYWSNRSEGYIESSGLDSGVSEIIGTSSEPYFLDIDVENQKIYWWDSVDNTIYYDDMDGDFRTVVAGTFPAGGILFASNNYMTGKPSQTLNLFVEVAQSISTSGDLFMHGPELITASGDFFIHGPELVTSVSGEGNLFIKVPEPSNMSGNFFIAGPELIVVSGDFFIKGSLAASEFRIINRLTRTADYSPQLIGSFDLSPASVNIEVWDIVDGQNTVVAIVNSGCYAIGDTGKFGWSTEYIPLAGGQNKYHYYYRMTSDNSEEVYGEFLITVPERGRWSYPS